MSGGFGLPIINLQSALGSLGENYDANFEKERSRVALAKLGEHLKVGDYTGAASTAFDSGDPQTGIGLLKLGQQQRQQQLQQAASEQFSKDLGGGFGLNGPQSVGPQADAAPSARALPSFADTGAPSGSYVANLFKRESNNNDLAQAPTSSARGAGQFTRGTWNRVAAQNPDLNLTPVGNGQDGRTDRGQMLRATNALTAQNERILQSRGLPVNDATRYATHFLGAGGGPRLVAGAMQNPDAPALSYANPDQVRANRNVFFNRDGSPKSAGQVMSDFGRSFGGGGGSRQASAPTSPGRVAYADDEAQTQALEQRMGMVPRQTASFDPRADMPAEGAEPANFVIPGGSNPVPPGLSTDMNRAPNPATVRTAPPSGMPTLDVPTLGGPAPTGRRMSMPGEEPADTGAAPVQVAENTRLGGSTVGAVMGSPLGTKIPLLMRAAANPNLPDGQRQLAQTLLKSALDETRMPDEVKQYMFARGQGFTGSIIDFKNEQRKPLTPTTVSPGQAVIAPGERSPFYVAPPAEKAERDEGAKITAGVEARRALAPSLGLEEGSPAWKSYVGAGKLGADRDMSAGEKKSIETADGLALTGRTSISVLQEAKNLSAKAYAGPFASQRGQFTSVFGSEAGQATQELDNLVTANALASLKAVFGAAPTEGERKILLDIQGSSSLPHALRVKIYDRAIAAAEARADQNEQKADAIRNGTYFKRGGGAAIRAPGGAVEADAGAARSLPAPSPANRPGAVPAADRFKQLSASGLSKAEAYQRLHDEGY
ncbi:hypothetical protein [Methylobacterium sp. WL6]|uniref:hypothetical protein n=1 Tax=Methylobacterium sp. WL6 TaxID=2603901 RepID=UPI0011C96043|nr:hypothetical protein [Methylobacterium sp. WL6]TXN73429.1 hypothetical protein FV230_01270 [Methylobacterium sp. WL6]